MSRGGSKAGRNRKLDWVLLILLSACRGAVDCQGTSAAPACAGPSSRPVESNAMEQRAPVTHLAPARRLSATAHAMRSAGEFLLVGERERTSLFAPLDAGRTLAQPGPFERLIPVQGSPRVPLLTLEDGALAGFDPERGVTGFRKDVLPAGATGRLSCAQATDGVLLVELEWARDVQSVATRLWVGLDEREGTLLWKLTPSDDRWLCPFPRAPSARGLFPFKTRAGGVGVLAARSGAPVWEAGPAAPPDWMVEAGDTLLVSAAAGPLRALSLAEGRPRWSLSLEGRMMAALVADGGTAWVLTLDGTSPERGPDHPKLVAVDLTTGKPRFEAAWRPVSGQGFPVSRGGALGGSLLLDGDALYVLVNDGLIHAFDRRTGEQRWHWGIGAGREAVLLRSPRGASALAVMGRDGRVELFERGARVAPYETARISGRVTIDGLPRGEVPVLVGDALTATDAAGRFSLEVTSRGRLSVHVGQPCAASSPAYEGDAELELDGRADAYEAVIAAASVGCE